ncbi:PREDICTED: L-ascorbate oxidase homolog [Tarenaya hassleriana]|uniref:L-ascorbate oxidase homolog n=1 Tax=Tarenaya hassleriana TaxID=28532 RepID=UPI00053C82B4|nr:PREDICTED: L-ascorbate oxidase homolog [Tarenaya hassleriana]
MEGKIMLAAVLCLAAVAAVKAGDPYFYYTWNVSYGTASPLGVPQQVILINGQFPGPNINSTSNNNIVINVFNNLDEPFLLHWSGIQHRKNCWQDGLPATTCPIMPGQNFTYHFQPKDQIGSYFYYPSTSLHRFSGGFGGLRVNSRLLIPVPYPDPEDDYTVLISDWYTKSHTSLKNLLDSGRALGSPDGVLINGKSAKMDGKDQPLFTMKLGKTYKYRICNVGFKSTLNFRIQNHKMKLVEMEGSHVLQNDYDSLDVHVGQCFAVLVTADQTATDYYMVASSRFLKKQLSGTGLIRYEGGQGQASPVLPKAPVGWAWSLNQFRSFRWNLTASAARPNPQGSYHYGKINITRTIKLVNSQKVVDRKLRFGFNGVSHIDTETPLKLAEYFQMAEKVFKYNVIKDEPAGKITGLTVEPNVLNITFRTFVEVIFENHEKSMQSYHLDGYSFFAVATEPGRWSPAKRENYNLLDAVSRHTVQVYPNSWSAILLTFDNAGMWNIRSENWERRYLGQQLYVSVLSPEKSLRDEYNIPLNAGLCGIVKDLPKPSIYS